MFINTIPLYTHADSSDPSGPAEQAQGSAESASSLPSLIAVSTVCMPIQYLYNSSLMLCTIIASKKVIFHTMLYMLLITKYTSVQVY